MEAQAIFAIFPNQFTICLLCELKFVFCLVVDGETNGSYLFAIGLNGLNGLNRLNGLNGLNGPNGRAYLWCLMIYSSSTTIFINWQIDIGDRPCLEKNSFSYR
jgi:hypothetical protein